MCACRASSPSSTRWRRRRARWPRRRRELADDRGADRRSGDRPRDARARRGRAAARCASGSTRCAASSACSSSRATPRTTAAPSWRCAPAPAATRRRSSPAISFACTSAMRRCTAGRSRCSRRARARSGGYREIVAAVRGAGVYARLKFESGVHRVQRVPTTEASGRIHTSAATVAVLPEAEDVDIEIKPEDIRIDTTRASSAGGQHANTTEIGGPHAAHPDRHHRHGEREARSTRTASARMQVLRARLFDLERQKQDERAPPSARARSAPATARSASAPTIFRKARVTDHRINLTLYKLDKVLDGRGARRGRRRADRRRPGEKALRVRGRRGVTTYGEALAEARAALAAARDRERRARRAPAPGRRGRPRHGGADRAERTMSCRPLRMAAFDAHLKRGLPASRSPAFSARRNSGACRSG